MKTCIIAGILALTLPTLGHAEIKAGCAMVYQNAKAGSKKIPVFSDHIFTLTNNTGITKAYHVEYENFIMFQNPYYSPNAKFVHDFSLSNGQTLQATQQRITGMARFSMTGKYPTEATTTIYMDNQVIAKCTNKNVADIF